LSDLFQRFPKPHPILFADIIQDWYVVKEVDAWLAEAEELWLNREALLNASYIAISTLGKERDEAKEKLLAIEDWRISMRAVRDFYLREIDLLDLENLKKILEASP